MNALDLIAGRKRELRQELAELDAADHELQKEQRRVELIEAYRRERTGVEAWVRRYANADEAERVEVPTVHPHQWKTVAASRTEWAERLDGIDGEIRHLEAQAPK